ncbi:MAG: response regulator [Candidatus Thiodiazotropha sp. (ex Dulcina madagascariensis)]|nr:response regulator [Candidatus Thiodiazotropha sp. (ex Dulcina madagascariensis)]
MYKSLINLLRRKTTIRFRIYLFSGVMLFFFYFASIFSFFTHLDDVKKARKESIDFIVSELLTKTAGQALWRGNRAQLESVIKTLLDSTEIRKIVVKDSKGEIFISDELDENRSGNVELFSVNVVWQRLSAEFDDFDIDMKSVADREVKVGQITVEVDQDALSNLVWSAMIEKSYALFIALILSMPVGYILAMSLVHPLRIIMSDLKRFESGDYSSRLPTTDYMDEYALLSSALARAGDSIERKTKQIEEASNELRKHSEELENQVKIAIEARRAADEANERKDIFVANITHEFKRPLTGVVSGLDLIEHGVYEILSKIDDIAPDSGITHEAKISLRNDIFRTIISVDTAKYGSREISDMMNEILVSIQDIYDDIRLNERPVQLNASLMNLIKSHKVFAKHKGLDFGFSCSGCEDVWVLADWVRVAQVLNSLIGNAIRFTEKGGVDVSVRIRLLSDCENVSLFVEVRDTGIGISDKEKDAIFNLFHIAQHPKNKVVPGIGTGLAIAKKVTEKLGGSIALKSSLLKSGSCFTFECAFNKFDQGDVAGLETPISIAAAEYDPNINLLYVEDSVINQLIFQQYCLKHGVNLIMANNGIEGFDKYAKGRFDALVVDCYMPLGDGFELVSKIREHEESAGAQRSLIFALTADDSEKNRKRCEEHGFDGFIAKPYTDESYTFILKRVLTNRKA